jgi:hypothetical protein
MNWASGGYLFVQAGRGSLTEADAERHRRIASVAGQPRVAVGVESGVIGIEVDEAALDQEVTNLEHVAPPSGMRDPRAPLAILVLSEARSLKTSRGSRPDTRCSARRPRNLPAGDGVSTGREADRFELLAAAGEVADGTLLLEDAVARLPRAIVSAEIAALEQLNAALLELPRCVRSRVAGR